MFSIDSASFRSSNGTLTCENKPPKSDFPYVIYWLRVKILQNFTKYLQTHLEKNCPFFLESNLQFCRSRIVLYESFGIGPFLQRAAEKSWSKVGVIYWLESIYYMLAFRPQWSDRANFLCIGKPGASTFQNFWTC